MCGIAGIFHYGEPMRLADSRLLARMARRLAHRGPDDEGIWVDGVVGLANRRLAIVDLTPTGHQPMRTEDGEFTITYNGEIYNHAEFRPGLASRGCPFRGTSDTETLLYLVSRYGPKSLAELTGIFAFALYDRREKRLILARDPLGVKQLYYHDDGRRVIFASEIKALFECPDVPREPDPEGINQYLHFHTPLLDRTFFKDIHQVVAGQYLDVRPGGIRVKSYWETDGFDARAETPDDGVRKLREMLGRVVGQQLMSDVPVGAFFSGGIDSSAVAAFAKKNGVQPRLFGLHFSGQGVVDERPYQEAAAKALGLDLELTTIDGADFPDDFMKLHYYQDQPVIGAAMVSMYHVSKLASRHVKVCLGGQAADEVFGGYARYALVHPAKVLSLWLKHGAQGSDAAGSAAAEGKISATLLKQLTNVSNLKRIARSIPRTDWRSRYFENFVKVPEERWRRVFADTQFVSRRNARETFEAIVARSPAAKPADKILHWDMQTYLTGLFHQDDRMSMANSLESRVPLADPRLVRFAFHTDFDLKLRGGATKWILRQAVSDVLPTMVLNRRKVGFDTPAELWMRGRHFPWVRELLAGSRARARGFWHVEEVEKLLLDKSSSHWFDVIWKLAAIEAWACVFLDRPLVSGDENSDR
jgi:asparagine synthase (glutamine-hydrolysing)